MLATAAMVLAAMVLLVVVAGATAPPDKDEPPARIPAAVATQPPAQPPSTSGDVGDDVRSRDRRRFEDLQAIAQVLEGRREGYPSTSNQIQTMCVFTNLDKLCVIRNQVEAARMVDPRGTPTTYGYWYMSDGKTFTLLASMEGDNSGSQACPEQASAIKQPNVYCLNGKPR
jgi:hypothetical protein